MQDTLAVRERLRTALGEFVDVGVDDDGDLYLDHGLVRGYVAVDPFHDEHTCLTVSVLVAHGLPISNALFRWVAVKAVQFRFGQLGAVVRDDDRVNVSFVHSVLVDDLTDERLRATVLPVVFSSDDLRTELHALFAE